MPERQGSTGAKVSISKLLVVRDIRATYTGGLDGYLQLSNAWFFNDPTLLQVTRQRTTYRGSG